MGQSTIHKADGAVGRRDDRLRCIPPVQIERFQVSCTEITRDGHSNVEIQVPNAKIAIIEKHQDVVIATRGRFRRGSKSQSPHEALACLEGVHLLLVELVAHDSAIGITSHE